MKLILMSFYMSKFVECQNDVCYLRGNYERNREVMTCILQNRLSKKILEDLS